MGEILILVLIAATAVAAFTLLYPAKSFGAIVSCKSVHSQDAVPSDPGAFSCRVQLTKQGSQNCSSDTFRVEICGSIHAPADTHYATVQISITDVTEGAVNARPVRDHIPNWQIENSPSFVYNADLGRLPNRGISLPDWTAVAALPLDRLIFPRKGQMMLQFNISVLSRESGERLACDICTFPYENPSAGYIDQQENIMRTKTLAVALAFAVSAADGKLYDCEIELVKNWAKDNIDVSGRSSQASRKLEKALNKTIRFFRQGNHLDTYQICKEIVEIAFLAERYDILELCLYVAQAKGFVAAEELALLKNIAGWLETDAERFRTMVGKILPADMHHIKDEEIVLGVTSDMSSEQTRRHLNKEYRKWNARVTSFDSKIRSQADLMLKIIAEARSKYTAHTAHNASE